MPASSPAAGVLGAVSPMLNLSKGINKLCPAAIVACTGAQLAPEVYSFVAARQIRLTQGLLVLPLDLGLPADLVLLLLRSSPEKLSLSLQIHDLMHCPARLSHKDMSSFLSAASSGSHAAHLATKTRGLARSTCTMHHVRVASSHSEVFQMSSPLLVAMVPAGLLLDWNAEANLCV